MIGRGRYKCHPPAARPLREHREAAREAATDCARSTKLHKWHSTLLKTYSVCYKLNLNLNFNYLAIYTQKTSRNVCSRLYPIIERFYGFYTYFDNARTTKTCTHERLVMTSPAITTAAPIWSSTSPPTRPMMRQVSLLRPKYLHRATRFFPYALVSS